MILVILGVLAAGLSLIICDKLRAQKKISVEVARKIPHIILASAIAYWPWFLSWTAIMVVAILYIAVAFITNQLGIFRQLRSVHRITWGEYFFFLAIIALAIMQPSFAVFAVAMLHLGFADAFAALVGQAYSSKKGKYKVLGQTKSILGSVVFWLISSILVMILVLNNTAYRDTGFVILLIVPIAITLLENIGVYGSDNFLVPVVVAVMLQAAQTV